MAKKILIIDGSIGNYGYSKQWLNYMLNGADNDEIEVQISSLGGSVDHAIAMHDRFASHGSVTSVLTGMVASSGTVIALSTYTRMSQNSMYLIHKAMIWIDEWGTMNEDDIDELIAKLGKEKNEVAKVTLVIAKMYATKSGKGVKEILDLMKKQTWLTADEAKEWGFVDEVFAPSKVINYAEDLSMVAMLQANGYPVPERKGAKPPVATQVDEESLFNRLSTRFQEIFKPKHNSMKKQFLNLNKVLKVEKLESSDEGVFLNEQQLESIEQDLSARAQADTARSTAETSLTNATTALDSIDVSVKNAVTIENKVAAIKTLLAQKPGSKPSGVQGKKDPEVKDEGVDWDTLNSLPHMKEVD
ncbi:MAG: peptidase S14 ClpP [Bacteroidetes bacterium]|nr:MAG: peptidase S14 ClpP [Bacteroidota bacterium]